MSSSQPPQKPSRAKIVAIAFLIYLVTFGISLAAEQSGMIPAAVRPVLAVIYFPIIWAYMTVINK